MEGIGAVTNKCNRESEKHQAPISYWLLQRKSQLVYLKRLKRNMRHVGVYIGVLIIMMMMCPSSNSVGFARWLADVRVCVCVGMKLFYC